LRLDPKSVAQVNCYILPQKAVIVIAIINALECSADDVFSDVIKFGYKIKSSRLSERLEALPPEEREKAFAILDAFISKAK